MRRTTKVLLAGLVLTIGLSAAGQAEWFHSANLVRTPNGNLAHAEALVQVTVLATDMVNSQVCVRYTRESDKVKQGRIKTTARFFLAEDDVRAVSFVEGVAQNEVLSCKKAPNAPLGTVVEFSHQFLGMPRVFGKKGHYVDVSGIVGESAFDLETLGLAPAEEDARGRINSARSIFTADKASQRHPVLLAQTAVASRLLLEPRACVSYRRAKEGNQNKGRFVAQATVIYPDGETEKLDFAAGVKKGEAIRCKELSREAPIGTMIESDIQFRKMPRLRNLNAQAEYFDVSTSLSTAGDVAFRPAPVPDVVDGPGNENPGAGPPPPPGPGTAGLSGLDQRCISRVLYAGGAGSRQIVRPRGNKGGKFEIFGPRSRVANGAAVPATLGFGSTYAAACNDYERKMGNLGPEGRALSGADVSAWIWYSNMNSAAGPTAVRKDPRGGFHGDYWRPSTGVVIFSGPNPLAILRELQRRGL